VEYMSDEEDDLLKDEDDGPTSPTSQLSDDYERPGDTERGADGSDAEQCNEEGSDEECVDTRPQKPDNDSGPEDSDDAEGADPVDDLDTEIVDPPLPAYIMFNRSAYSVGSCTGPEAGRVRDYNHPIVVDDATTLGQMSNAKNWPAAEQMPPLAVVVVKGRHEETTPFPLKKESGTFHWYARVVIKGKEDSADRNILRPIPKALVVQLITYIARIESMKTSSLIVLYQPHENNAKTFPMQPNNWQKASGIKSDAIPTNRAKRNISESSLPCEDGQSVAVPEGPSKRMSMEADSSEKQPDEKKPKPPDEKKPKPPDEKKPKPPDEKKPKPPDEKTGAKGSMIHFTNSLKKPTAPAPETESETADTTKTFYTNDGPFKSYTKIKVANKQKVHLEWSGNDLWICETN
jgi:hypothetical protein